MGQDGIGWDIPQISHLVPGNIGLFQLIGIHPRGGVVISVWGYKNDFLIES